MKTSYRNMMCVMALSAVSVHAAVVFVNDDAAGLNDGSSWTDAYVFLQNALNDINLQAGDEIWIAAGTYFPDDGTNITPGDRSESFTIPSGVKVYGSLNGDEDAATFNPPTIDNRGLENMDPLADPDPTAPTSILSGDIGAGFSNRTRNVVVAVGVVSATRLDGVTITRGRANLGPSGGGVHLDSANITMANCVVSENFFSGMGAIGVSDPVFTNCWFIDNNGSTGGGATVLHDCSPTFEDCVFDGNSAVDGGGLRVVSDVETTIIDCTFRSNTAGSDGGGLAFGFLAAGGQGDPHSGFFSITGGLIEDNVSEKAGGGVFVSTEGDYAMADVRFVGNRSGRGGGVMSLAFSSSASFTDCFSEENEADRSLRRGGGVFMSGNLVKDDEAVFTRCTFDGNKAGKAGGGAYLMWPQARFELCRFENNVASFGDPAAGNGGGLYVSSSNGFLGTGANVPELVNTLFARNSAAENGGAISYEGNATSSPSDPPMTLCTFAENTAGTSGGGIAYSPNNSTAPALTSCILWGNTDAGGEDESAQIHKLDSGANATFDYSDIKDFTGVGTGNIAVDLLFRDPDGLLNTDPLDDFYIGDVSPCIDAGDPGFVPVDFDEDLEGDPRLANLIVDIGVDEFSVCQSETEANCCDAENFVDCDEDGRMDACQIQELPMFDQDLNGILDTPCQPCIDHDAGSTSFSSHAFGGFIDPRRESTDGTNLNQGMDEETIVFCETVGDSGGNALVSGDFAISVTGGTAPTISNVTTSDNQTFTLTLSTILPVQEWTTIGANVFSLTDPTIPIVDAGNQGASVSEPDRVDIGFLPADVNQSGTVEPLDLFTYRQYVNDVASPPIGAEDDYTDVDRSGSTTPLDLFLYRQLINGTNPPSTKNWTGQSLPTRP